MQEIEIDEIALHFLQTAEKTNKSIFLTGKWWAWKSTLVNYFLSKTKKKVVLLWTTWIAAININGQTIDKFFWFIPKLATCRMKWDNIQIARWCDIIIIDESSMLRSDKFDRLDHQLKFIMNNDLFMWGKQVIFVWDLYQLPPVEEKDEELKKYFEEKYSWVFFFNWNSFLKENFEIIELKKVHRQKDPVFIKMLNRLRIWDNRQDLLDYFNSRLIEKNQANPHAILIWMTNAVVDKKNALELSKIPTKEHMSVGYITGDYSDDILAAEKFLKIKKGARVMFTVNDKNNEYVNWTLWFIKEIIENDSWYPNNIIVETDEWSELKIYKNQWINSLWEDEFWEPIIDWTFSQFPFKLAFAITSHKVQGKSFDNIIVDVWYGCFASGQLYVAFSRARSYEGIQLLKPITARDIKVDYNVRKFLKLWA